MRTFDHSPLFRATVGFERLFDLIDAASRPNFPPYDIEKIGEDHYRISMAVAGFRPDEIEVSQNGSELTVAGKKAHEKSERQLLHQGIAFRDFRQSFRLAAHVKVTQARLENGLLCIDLEREVPEELKPRKIEIVTAASAAPAIEGETGQAAA